MSHRRVYAGAIVGALLLCSTVASTAIAAPWQLGGHRSVSAWADAGFDQTWAASVGAGGWVPVIPLRIYGQLTVPWVGAFSGGRVDVAASYALRLHRWFTLNAEGALSPTWSVDSLGSTVSFGTALALQPGVVRERWAIGAEISMRWAWLIVFTPSRAVAALYGDRPGSALQAPSQATLPFAAVQLAFGLYAHVVVAQWERSQLAIFARGGYVATPTTLDVEAVAPLATLPFHAVMGVAWQR